MNGTRRCRPGHIPRGVRNNIPLDINLPNELLNVDKGIELIQFARRGELKTFVQDDFLFVSENSITKIKNPLTG